LPVTDATKAAEIAEDASTIEGEQLAGIFRGRRAALLLGLLALACAWIGPLPWLAERAFFGHMTMHMIVVAVAASLLGVGIAGTRADPVLRWPALFPPVPVSLIEFVAVWAWHAPAMHHVARASSGGLIAEQGSFLVSGLLLWISVLGGATAGIAERRGAGIVALLLTSMHMTLLGALLALSPRPLYPHGGFGELSPLADQHLGGVVMLAVGGVTYLAGALVMLAGLLREREVRE
jgi:putative membrane protein